MPPKDQKYEVKWHENTVTIHTSMTLDKHHFLLKNKKIKLSKASNLQTAYCRKNRPKGYSYRFSNPKTHTSCHCTNTHKLEVNICSMNTSICYKVHTLLSNCCKCTISLQLAVHIALLYSIISLRLSPNGTHLGLCEPAWREESSRA